MALFGKGKGGGMMNVIRCDEQEYLLWKWRPLGQEVNSTSRENAIRYGSSLRVKDGETAIFVYKQKDGTMQDFIEGPYDDTIKTANFPILSSIVGLGFGGESPFQAEVYFINTAGIIKINFGIPYFDVCDPRFMDFPVPVTVGGSLSFYVGDVKAFIKAHRLINFSLDDLRNQIKDVIIRRVKGVVSNAPDQHQIPLLKIETKIDEINDLIKPKLVADLEDFAVNVKRLDISRIEIDKNSPGYRELKSISTDLQKDTLKAQSAINIKNMSDMQDINARNTDATLAIQREEAQRAQRLQTETQFIGAHALNRQSDVMQTAAANLGGGGFGGGTGSSGINPAQFMTGMAVGSALGGQMANAVNQMGQQMTQQWQQTASMQSAPTPPPMPGAALSTQYTVAINGQQYGPYTVAQMQPMAANGQIDRQTLVWAQGMAQWTPAGQVNELQQLFGNTPPPMPGAHNGSVPPPMP